MSINNYKSAESMISDNSTILNISEIQRIDPVDSIVKAISH